MFKRPIVKVSSTVICVLVIVILGCSTANAQTKEMPRGMTIWTNGGDGNWYENSETHPLSCVAEVGDIGDAASSANQVIEQATLSSIDTKLSSKLQCISPAANNKSAYSTVTNSSTTVDAGCTGDVALYVKATNLSRTYDVKFTGPDGGSGRIPPNGVEFFCKSGSATADSLVFDSTCDTCNSGRVSITAGCVN